MVMKKCGPKGQEEQPRCYAARLRWAGPEGPIQPVGLLSRAAFGC